MPARLSIAGVAHSDKRELVPKLLYRTPVFCDRRIDLLWEALVVGKGQVDAPRVGAPAIDHALHRSNVAIGVHDLPNVKGCTDDPCAALPVGSPESDPREQPHAQRLLGE